MILTPETIAGRCAYWQPVLRLQDWDVEARFARSHEMRSKTSLGQASIDAYRRARILVLDPLDYTSDDHWPIDRDPEATLVHELLHLHVDDCRVKESDDLGRWTPEWTALERAIETTARALVTLDRATGSDPA